MPEVVVTAVGPGEVDDLAPLFATQPSTRSCWCTAFCSTGGQFALGWVTGRNRRHLAKIAEGGEPIGVLASVLGEPVGWAACGPRSRYAVARAGRSSPLAALDRSEDATAWLVACLFVRSDHRGRGLSGTLVAAAVDLARARGAVAVEGWPVTGTDDLPGTDFVGRESTFAAAGFVPVARPEPGRVLVRLDLRASGSD